MLAISPVKVGLTGAGLLVVAVVGALVVMSALFGSVTPSIQSGGCVGDPATTGTPGGEAGLSSGPAVGALIFHKPGGGSFGMPEPGQPTKDASTGEIAGSIPVDYLAAYQQVGAATGIAWALLAGIGFDETGHGGNTNTSSAGAQGPMQFMPRTFAAYGVDGDGDGRRDVRNYKDAIASAANYLLANGVTTDPVGVRNAVFNYNHATWYYNDVLTWANQYGAGPVATTASRSGDTAEEAAVVVTTGITGATSSETQSGTATVSSTAATDPADAACAAQLLASQNGGQVVVGGSSAGGTGSVNVSVSGNTVTIPNDSNVLAAWRGRAVTFADSRIARGVANAMTWLGLSYSWGGGHGSNGAYPTKGTSSGCYGGCITYGDVNITGWDCSGLMLNIAWGWGVLIPGSSGPQVNGAPVKVPLAEAQPGDMVGWSGHVALFLGRDGGNVIVLEAPQSGQRVHIGINNPSNSTAARWWQAVPTQPLPSFQTP